MWRLFPSARSFTTTSHFSDAGVTEHVTRAAAQALEIHAPATSARRLISGRRSGERRQCWHRSDTGRISSSLLIQRASLNLAGFSKPLKAHLAKETSDRRSEATFVRSDFENQLNFLIFGTLPSQGFDSTLIPPPFARYRAGQLPITKRQRPTTRWVTPRSVRRTL